MALPGVSTVIKDRFYSLSRSSVPLGIQVAIIGRRTLSDDSATPVTNTDGTNTYLNRGTEVLDLDAYAPTSEQDVIEIFGYGSDLHRGYVEALAGGARRVILIPLPEDTVFDHVNGTISSASYTALAGSNTLFDDAFTAVESVRADIVVPWGRGAGPTEFQDPATPGDDLEFGFYADNSSSASASWLAKVAAKCAAITENTHPCFAVMGIKPYVGAATSNGGMTPVAIDGHIGSSGLANLVSRDDQTLGTDGVYVSVVATEITPVGYNRITNFGFSNGAAMYAGALSQLDSWSSPTGKTVFNAEQVRYNPTRTQQQNLIDKAVVPVALDGSRIPRWVDAMTFSKTGSDYTRLTTLRIVFDAVQMVRKVTQKFVGEAASIEARNSLETAISTGLRAMQQEGALMSSDFTVRYDGANNKAIIDLVLRPAFELRNIEVLVSVQL